MPLSRGSVLCVAGSRSATGGAVVSAVVAGAGRSGCSLVVSGAKGVSASALGAAVRLRVPVRVFCAFGPGGAGAFASSSVAGVARAVAAGLPVVWWSGGRPPVPPRARLSRRAAALVAASSAVFAVFASSRSAGTLGECRLALARGLPVWAVALPGVQLPPLGPGRWVPASLFCVQCSHWVSGQGALW